MTNGQDEQVNEDDTTLQVRLNTALATERMQSESRYTEMMCRSLLVLSGGAVLAIVAFAGNAASEGGAGIGRYLTAYGFAVALFAISALLAGAAPFYYGGAARSSVAAARTRDGAKARKQHENHAERFDSIGRRLWQVGMVLFGVALLAAAGGTVWIACTAS